MKTLKNMSDQEIDEHLVKIRKTSEERISQMDYISLLMDFQSMYKSNEIGLKKFLTEIHEQGQYTAYQEMENNL